MKNETRKVTAAAPDEGFPVPDIRFHQLDRPIAEELLRGVPEIAPFLLGSSDKSALRSIYHITETSSSIPVFKIGGMTCALKSSIRAKFWEQQRSAFPTPIQEDLVRLHILLTSILRVAAANDNGDTATHTDHTRPLLVEAAQTIQRVLAAGRR